MAANIASLDAEEKAYTGIKRLLGDPQPFASPAGFGSTFPDFGFNITVNKIRVNMYFEYKTTKDAQMGSMRDWTFDGHRFLSKSTDGDKEILLEVMNSSIPCVNSGKRLLNDFKNHFDKKINYISSDMLSVEKDLESRKNKLKVFIDNVDNYQLAKIKDDTLGRSVITYYENKFRNSVDSSNYNILYMVIGDEIFEIDSKGSSSNETNEAILRLFGVPHIPKLNNMRANLEVRIQPRGMNSNNQVRIDTMSSFRMVETPVGAKLKL